MSECPASDCLNDVSAVTVTYGNAEMARASVQSALGAGVREVIVWDNTQDAEQAALIRQLASPGVIVLSDGTNLGFGRACNAAADVASGDFLLFLNPDCTITRDALASTKRLLLARRDHGVVVPRMVYPDGSVGISGGGGPSLLKELLAATEIDELLPARLRVRLIGVFERVVSRAKSGTMAESLSAGTPLEVSWVSGFCMLIRSEDFRLVNGFDPRFFLYFEDADLCYRLRDNGLKALVNRNAMALHAERSSTGPRKSAYYWNGLQIFWQARGRKGKARVSRMCARIFTGRRP